MTTIKLLIIDLDGTLVDTKRDITSALNRTFKEYGVSEIDEELVSKYVGTGVNPIIKERIKEEDLENFEKSFSKNYISGINTFSKIYLGFEEILFNPTEIKKVILSNKPQKYCDPLIKSLGLEKIFFGVFGAEAFKEKKPSPLPILEILKLTNTEKENALIIGDMPSDIISGKSAAIKTCAALYGYGKREELLNSMPDFTIESPIDLIKVI